MDHDNPLMMEKEEYEIARPNAGSLMQSLRAFGYDIATAIADLIDNSIGEWLSGILTVEQLNDFDSILCGDERIINKWIDMYTPEELDRVQLILDNEIDMALNKLLVTSVPDYKERTIDMCMSYMEALRNNVAGINKELITIGGTDKNEIVRVCERLVKKSLVCQMTDS